MERWKFTREFKLEAVRLIKYRGVSYVQASRDLGVHPSQLRDWVKKFADDPQHAFPGHGQMKPEQNLVHAAGHGYLTPLLLAHSSRGAFLTPSPPDEKTRSRQDQARQASARRRVFRRGGPQRAGPRQRNICKNVVLDLSDSVRRRRALRQQQ
jgi:transposase-like protein